MSDIRYHHPVRRVEIMIGDISRDIHIRARGPRLFLHIRARGPRLFYQGASAAPAQSH